MSKQTTLKFNALGTPVYVNLTLTELRNMHHSRFMRRLVARKIRGCMQRALQAELNARLLQRGLVVNEQGGLDAIGSQEEGP